MHPNQTLLRLRDALKARLGREQFLALLRVESGVAAMCARALSLLPRRQQTQIRERLQPIGLLDYPHARIRMAVTEGPELVRLRSCAKEPETVSWLERTIRPGDVVYDIGANVGAYALLAAELGGNGCRVFAFEPGFATFASLSRNVHLNQLADRIVPLPVALADCNTMVNFCYRDLRAGAADHASAATSSFHPVHQQPTIAYRLDDFVRSFGLPMPNLIKIDVDGAELSVVHGARETLAGRALRSLQIEICGSRTDAVIALVRELGWHLASQTVRASGIGNYVFTRSEA